MTLLPRAHSRSFLSVLPDFMIRLLSGAALWDLPRAELVVARAPGPGKGSTKGVASEAEAEEGTETGFPHPVANSTPQQELVSMLTSLQMGLSRSQVETCLPWVLLGLLTIGTLYLAGAE
jgi:hypothetical protein